VGYGPTILSAAGNKKRRSPERKSGLLLKESIVSNERQ